MSKPTVVVLGGLGFLGRRMVEHLVREDLADCIRVVDKAVKQTSYLDAAAAAALADPRVTVIQANLASEAGANKALAPFPGDRQPEFVFNLAGESKYGQDDTAYTKGILELTRLCASAAKTAGVRQFIQVSTAQVLLILSQIPLSLSRSGLQWLLRQTKEGNFRTKALDQDGCCARSSGSSFEDNRHPPCSLAHALRLRRWRSSRSLSPYSVCCGVPPPGRKGSPLLVVFRSRI
jgi:NAD(P)-dependent dehydrogenase (short-subunit alcohol dehydrogenase family)